MGCGKSIRGHLWVTAKEEDSLGKKEISSKEAIEFLRIIQQSEFKVIEQLNKTPVRISLLGLLMHKNALIGKTILPIEAILIK